ncbi:MAG: DEAD/DEAH box helicase, partial [Amnibacterium sp.]
MSDPEAVRAGWRDAVGRLVAAGTGPVGMPAPTTPLALRFQLRRLLPRTASRWNGPTSEALKPGAPGEVRLGMRPVLRTARGWAAAGVTWASLPHQQHRLELDALQQRWFRELAALHRAAAPPAVGQDTDWLVVDDFANPVLWSLLAQSAALGVPLVGPTAAGTVRVGAAAEVVLDAARSAGGLTLAPRLLVDGEPLPGWRARPIGAHGLYAFDPAKPADVVLAPAAEPLDGERMRLLGDLGGDEVAVPAADVAEFLRDHLPTLRDVVPVASSDGSVALPPPAPPSLVLTAAFAPGHVLRLDWRWERPRHGAVAPALDDVVPPGLLPGEWIGGGGVGAVPAPAVLRGLDAADFTEGVLPRLEELPGVRVEVVGARPDYRELPGTPRLTVTTVPSERTDWFDLGVVVTVDGRRVPFGQLFKALASGRRRILLADGRHLALTHPAFGPLKALLDEAMELAEWETGTPSISRYRTELWADFEDLADETRPPVEWQRLLEEVRGVPQPVPPPDGLRAELRPYQADGLAWLAFLHRHGLGGVLADDMGLGKTLQCLALVQHVAEQPARIRRPFLVVAPTSVVSNWAAEAARFTPGLVVRTVTATEARGTTVEEAARDADLVVTSYALLRLDAEAYQAVGRGGGWAGLILDEAQTVKNPDSRIHECVRDLEAPVKLAVTGTPLENSLTELRAVFAVVAPGLFPSARRFAEEYVRPIEQPPPGIRDGAGAGSAPTVSAGLRAERLERLRRRIRPFLLRRTKEQVAPELPPKQEQVLTVDLAP